MERYGFLKTVYGRKLWARSEWGTLLPLIHARMRISNEHFLTAYHAITKPKFNALPEVERKVWDEEAKAMNEGNGTEESKAMYVLYSMHGQSVDVDDDMFTLRYGDLVFGEFIYNFLHCGEQYFGAHMVIMSCRPSVRLDTPYAHSMYVTDTQM